ncbi:MAG: cysteine desulfurase family protein [Acidimicrobiia bacterium]
MARAYLDHASSSPLRPAALDAMLPFLAEHHGDPARLHAEGRVTRVAVEQAREQVAALFGARPREVIFTSGGTEAVNHAIWGGVRRAGIDGGIVTTAVEHSSVLDACRRESGALTLIPVDPLGRFDPDVCAAAITDDTVLVSVQLANHEVGTRQPVEAICELARARGVLVHVDACTGAGHVPIDFAALGADLLSISAHKLGGPKGAGALLIRRGLRIPPLIIGGAQERERRGGLENVPAIVGFGAAAAELDGGQLVAEAAAERRITDSVARGAVATVPGVVQYGDPDVRVPHLVCLGIEGVEAEPILLALDQHGVAVHSGSACSSEALEPSPVLEAMGADADRSLRVSVGWSSTDDDATRLLDALPGIVASLRALRSS